MCADSFIDRDCLLLTKRPLRAAQFVERLQLSVEKEKQQAEVAVYLKHFDEAENGERMDRPVDLAIEPRMKLGD